MLLFIPGNVPSSKNGRITLKTGISLPSAATTLWRKNTRTYWSLLRKTFVEQCQGKTDPLILGIHFIRKTRHTWDFINPTETIQDEMSKHGWITDDNVEFVFPVPMLVDNKLWSYDPKAPGVLLHVHNSLDEVAYNFSKSLIKTL